MTAKRPVWHNAERMDKPDVDYATREYPSNLQKDLARLVTGVGVLDGFDVRILPQVGSQVGQIDIFNGRGYDWNGQFINGQTGTSAQRVKLGANQTEYWLEVEFYALNSDADQRAFWDSTVDNPDPLPDGQEIPIPQVYTRQTVYWRIVQPMRSNPVGLRSSSGYAPARFSDNDTYILPLHCIRTNTSGQIVSGNPDVDLYGNDLVSVVTAAGTEQYVNKVGYGEARHYDSGNVKVIGRKTTDQRPRMFEPLLPLFEYGATNEVLGDASSDLWVRDWKSAYDHLAHAIGQIKHGANENNTTGDGDFGQWHFGEITAVDPDWRWVDIKLLAWPWTGAYLNTEADQLINTTFQVYNNNWRGFYAQVKGNDAEDVSGVTRLYLNKQSNYPEWKEGLAPNTQGRVVQHRQANWVGKPTPNSDYRGLNALDDEVLAGRIDVHSGVTFTNITNRISGGKGPALTVRPIAASHAVSADVPQSDGPTTYTTQFGEISTAIQRVVSVRGGGIILFRTGVHSFDAMLPLLTLFSISGANGLTFQGEGLDNTILDYGLSDTTIDEHKIFSLSSCSSITFRDMTIRGVAKLLNFSSCTTVQFINCKVDGRYVASDILTANFGSAVGWTIENCQFITAGRGLSFDSFENSVFQSSRINCIDDTMSHHERILAFESLNNSFIVDNRIVGVASEYGVKINNPFVGAYFANRHEISIGITAEARMWVPGSATQLNFLYNRFLKNNSAGVPSSDQSIGVRFRDLAACNIVGNYVEDVIQSYLLGSLAGGGYCRSGVIENNKAIGVSSSIATSFGMSIRGAWGTKVSGNYTTNTETGLQLVNGEDATIVNNICRNNKTGYDLQSMTGSSLLGNRSSASEERHYDMRNATENMVSGNKFSPTSPIGFPSIAIFDLTGGSWNAGGRMREMLAGATPAVTLPAPSGSVGGLYLNDGLSDNDVYLYNR